MLTLADGIEYEKTPGVQWVTRFGGSLRRVNEHAEMVFFTSGVHEDVAPLLESVGLVPCVFGAEPEPWSAMEVATRRWYIFRRYLEEHPEFNASWVLAIDARDTYFQRDPFTMPRAPGDDLHVYLEGMYSIGSSDWNSNVISACYEQRVLNAVFSKPISCSGTVYGSYAAMLVYLRAMEREILETASFGQCMSAGGRDQGFHNVMLHTGRLAAAGLRVRQFSNDDGPIQTMQFAHTFRDTLGRVLNQRGEVAYIVHQWDRKKEIVDMILTYFPVLPNPSLPPGYPQKRRTADELQEDCGGFVEPATREA